MANRILPPSKRPHRQLQDPDAPDRVRKATRYVAAVLKGTTPQSDESLSAKTLEYAKRAVQKAREGGGVVRVDRTMPDGSKRSDRMIDLEGVFELIVRYDWSPMDDRKAETFYAIVEAHLPIALELADSAPIVSEAMEPDAVISPAPIIDPPRPEAPPDDVHPEDMTDVDRLKLMTWMIVGLQKFARRYDDATIADNVMACVKGAVKRVRDNDGCQSQDVIGPDGEARKVEFIDPEGMLSILVRRDWSPMTEYKAETFYRVVEEQLPVCLEDPECGLRNPFD